MSRHALAARAQLRLEELPPELKGGEDAEIALAQGDEGRQQHHRVGGEMVRLELIEFQPGAEEGAHWQAEAAKEVRVEDHPLAIPRLRPDFLRGRKADRHFVRAGQPPRIAEELDVILVDVGAIPIPTILLRGGRHGENERGGGGTCGGRARRRGAVARNGKRKKMVEGGGACESLPPSISPYL